MAKTLTISDEIYDSIILSSIEESLRDREEFDPMDWSGGNYDDAFELGENEGYNCLAKSIVNSARIEAERK